MLYSGHLILIFATLLHEHMPELTRVAGAAKSNRFTTALYFLLFAALFVFGAWMFQRPVNAGALTSVQIILSKTAPSSTQTNIEYSFYVTTTMNGTGCSSATSEDSCFRLRLSLPATSTAGYGYQSAFAVTSTIATSSNPSACAGANSDVCVKADGYNFDDLVVTQVVTSTQSSAATADYPDRIDVYLGSTTSVTTGTRIRVFFYNGVFTTPGFKPGHVEGYADIHGLGITTMRCPNFDGSQCQGTEATYDTGSSNVAIQEATTFTATVNESMTFTVNAVDAGTSIGTGAPIVTNIGSTTTSCPFGTLSPFVPKICAQRVEWITSAAGGAGVYVVQNGNMSTSTYDIDQFKDGTRLTPGTAADWTSPTGNPGDENSWGHLGYTGTSTDAAVTGAGNFSSGERYAGILTRPGLQANPDLIFASNSNALIASTAAANSTEVHAYSVYKIEVSSLQESGTYSNEIQYQIVASY